MVINFWIFLFICRNPARSPNKVIVYSRSSPLIHSLPAQFSCHTDSCESLGLASAKELVFENTNKLMLQKLSSIISQSSVQELLKDFVNSKKAEVLLLVANMQDASIRTINHIRVMMEEAELRGLQHVKHFPKLFIILLHFPPALFFNHCYPTLFVRGWDHIYLDTITHKSSRGMVDIQDWFWRCCFPTVFNNDSNSTIVEQNPAFAAAKYLLPHAIPVLSAQMYFGNKHDKSFNSSMNATQRGEALEKLLKDSEVGNILCKKFCMYWNPKVMLHYLEKAANFSMQTESSLNITDTIQTQFKTLFLNFCVYILTQANEHCNLDIIYAEEKSSAIQDLFIEIFQLFPIPKLSQLGVLSNILPTSKSLSHQSQFPFFAFVCDLMEKEVEISSESVNQTLNVLIEQEKDTIQNSASNSQKKLEIMTSAMTKNLEPLVEVSVWC